MRYISLFLLTLFGIVRNDVRLYNFNKFQRFDTINNYIQELSGNYPKLVTVEYPTVSWERRGIPLVKISQNKDIQNVIIFIEAGLHGREWLSTAVAMRIIRELVENKKNYYLTAEIDWYIAPVVNPDGYEYSFTIDKSWRKTTSIYKDCVGVDINRNFDCHWEPSKNCNQEFPGFRPFSEPESLFIRNQVLANTRRIKLYLSLHCCGTRIFHPWGFSGELPEDIDKLLDVAQKVQLAMFSVRQKNFVVGVPQDQQYRVPGSSYDWVKMVGKVNLSFAIQLAGAPEIYAVPEGEIAPAAKEMFEGVKAFHKDIVHKYVDN